MSRIFITYRREDTSSQAGRLYDWLGEHYGSEAVFKDVDSIEPGRPWRRAIENAVDSSDVVLAVIGPRWLDELKERSPGDDYVRYELEMALQKDRRVIPLLVNGASMPSPQDLPESLQSLTEFHAFDVSDARFRSDIDELLRRLDRVIRPQEPADRGSPTNGGQQLATATPAAPPPVATAGAVAPDELEAELKKWNWGAFLLTFIWGIGHGVMRSFLVLIPLYGLYEWVMLGLNGNRWAWEKRRYESVEQFRRSQRSWAKWGIIVSSILVLLVLASSGSGG